MRRILPLLLAIAAFTGFGVLWIVTDERAAQRIYDSYSSLNTGETGLSLASGYLARRTTVSILSRPLGREPIEPDAVVFRVAEELPVFFDPERLEKNEFGPPRPKQNPLLSDAEDAFVRGGGRVVLAAAGGGLDMTAVERGRATKVFPIWRRLPHIDLIAGRAFLTLRPRMHAFFVHQDRVVLARERIEKGELLVLSEPELLQNKHLGKNLELLAALAGPKRPVYFDEVPHGIVSDDGALALMKEWNLGPFLLLLGAVAVLIFWREGKRIGPAEDGHRETRSDAVDLVRSLGALYQGVTTDAEALVLYHEALSRTVASQTGLRGEPLRKRVEDLTGGFVAPEPGARVPRPVFERLLAQLNQGFETLQSRR
jgi:hypothetical protein